MLVSNTNKALWLFDCRVREEYCIPLSWAVYLYSVFMSGLQECHKNTINVSVRYDAYITSISVCYFE